MAKNKDRRIELAKELAETWDDLEQDMGEQAAYNVACEQLGIDPDEGYELLAMIGDKR